VLLTGQEDGMQTLEMSLSDLVTRGLISYEEALNRSLYPKEVAKGPRLAATADTPIAT
jgi:twitching motility protein PilT